MYKKMFLAVLVTFLSASPGMSVTKRVVIPEEDRFVPYVTQVKVGDSVRWINQDTDDHIVASIDVFSTTRKGVDHLLLGTDNNGGAQSTFTIRFTRPGVFPYYCRIHSQLDASNQPIAELGMGVQSPDGNYGTPMTGVVVVIPGNASTSSRRNRRSGTTRRSTPVPSATRVPTAVATPMATIGPQY